MGDVTGLGEIFVIEVNLFYLIKRMKEGAITNRHVCYS